MSVSSAPAPRTPVPQTSLISGAAVPSSGPAVPSPAVPSLAVDSTAASEFSSPAAFDLTNYYDYLTGSLKTIWEDSHCELCSDNNNQSWKCLWCGHFQKGRHHTRSVRYFAKQKRGRISVCPSVIPPAHAALYAKLYQAGTIKNEARTLVSSKTQSFGKNIFEAAAVVIGRKSGFSTTMNTLNFITVGWSNSIKILSDLSHQPSINAAMENASQTDICMSNNS